MMQPDYSFSLPAFSRQLLAPGYRPAAFRVWIFQLFCEKVMNLAQHDELAAGS
ncbi:MAG: hypothetical protein ABSF75_02640 [Terracidiphilus sp.]